MQFYCYECSLGKTYRLKLFHMTNNNLSCWLWMCVFAAVGNDSGSIYTEDICISNLKLLFCSLLHYTVLFCSVQFVFESYECSGLFKQYSYKWDDTQCSTEKCLSFFFFPYWFGLSPTDFTMEKPTQILYSNEPHTMRRSDVYSHQTLVWIQVPKLF